MSGKKKQAKHTGSPAARASKAVPLQPGAAVFLPKAPAAVFSGPVIVAFAFMRQNLQTRCLWPNVYSEVHAVHFKGKSKPWPSMQQRTMACRHLRIGLPVVFTNARSGRHALASGPIQLEPADLLEWNTSALACVSSRFRQTVHWAGAQCKAANTGQCGGSFPVQHRKCCNFGMNLAAKWHQYLAAAPPR